MQARTRQKESVRHRAGCRQFNEQFSFIGNKISVFKNNDRFSRTQNIVELKSTTSQKKNCDCYHDVATDVTFVTLSSYLNRTFKTVSFL